MIKTSGTRQGFCRACYIDAISRLCAGFTITRHGRTSLVFPPLEPSMAAAVRQAAGRVLETAGQGEASQHPEHAAPLMPS